MKVLKEFEIVSDGFFCYEVVNGKINYCPHLDGTKWCHLFKDLYGKYKRHQYCINGEIKEGNENGTR